MDHDHTDNDCPLCNGEVDLDHPLIQGLTELAARAEAGPWIDTTDWSDEEFEAFLDDRSSVPRGAVLISGSRYRRNALMFGRKIALEYVARCGEHDD